MIVDKKSINKFGDVPPEVMVLAKKADYHGKLFSQWISSLYVYYRESSIKNLEGWMIIDSLNRSIYNGLFYDPKNKEFFAHSPKDSLLYEYKNKQNIDEHARQFFMPGVAASLIHKHPSKRNY